MSYAAELSKARTEECPLDLNIVRYSITFPGQSQGLAGQSKAAHSGLKNKWESASFCQRMLKAVTCIHSLAEILIENLKDTVWVSSGILFYSWIRQDYHTAVHLVPWKDVLMCPAFVCPLLILRDTTGLILRVFQVREDFLVYHLKKGHQRNISRPQ